MTQISLFSIKNYKEQIPNMYSFAKAKDCSIIADCIYQSGSVVGDSLLITNPNVYVPNNVSNESIRSVCFLLLGHAPEVINEEKEKKTFSIE